MDRSEIIAYVEATGQWEIVAIVPPTSGASAEALAAFIAHAVNTAQHQRQVLHDAMEALEAVMKDGLDFSTEQSADRVVQSIKHVVG